MRLYLDTSAAGQLLLHEPQSGALREYLNTTKPTLISCHLLITELHRALAAAGSSADIADTFLDQLPLLPLRRELLEAAGRLVAEPGARLRSLDAIHLAAAIDLTADAVLTYDTRLADAAAANGLLVVAPA